MNFDTPTNKESIADINNGINRNWYSFFNTLRNGIVWRSQSGTTAQRPTKFLEIGLPYYDTTLNKPIWLSSISPITWKDAAGTTV